MQINSLLSGKLSNEVGVSSVYLLLATIFRDVASAELLKNLKNPQTLVVLEEFGCSFDEDFVTFEVDDDLLEVIAVDFTQLFIGPSDFISPYESIFHTRDDDDWGKLWGADTVKVKRFIESAGVDFAIDYGGIPDHISVELEFVARVTEKIEEAKVGDKYNDALYFLRMKKLFFDDHLVQWVSVFCDKTATKAKTTFYREIAHLLDAFVKIEHNDLAEDIRDFEAQIT